MNFKRAKTIFIFIFIFVNLFLTMIYRKQTLEKNFMSKETVIAILANNGITVSEKIIGTYEHEMDTVEVYNLINNKEQLLSSFLGKQYEESSPSYYKSGGKSLSFQSSFIEFIDDSPQDRSFLNSNQLNIGTRAIKKLQNMGIGNSALTVYSVYKNPNNYYITLAYQYKNYTIFNYNINLFATESGISSLNGTVLYFTPVKDQSYRVLPAENILLELLEHPDLKNNQPVTITSISLGYYLPEEQFDVSAFAIPAYEIKTTSGKIYYFDARQGISREFRPLSTRIELS